MRERNNKVCKNLENKRYECLIPDEYFYLFNRAGIAYNKNSGKE